MAGHRVDIAGKRFSHLVAQEPVGKNHRGVLWRCVCDCGAERVAAAGHLNGGFANHCGCLTGVHNCRSRAAQRAYKTKWERQKRAAAKAARTTSPVKRPNNGPLDVFLYGHPAPSHNGDALNFMSDQRFQELL